MFREIAGGERIVNREARVVEEFPREARDRQQERQWLHQMGRDAQQDRTLAQRFAHQVKIQHFQIAQSAVNQVRIPAAGAGREMIPLHQRDLQRAVGNFRAQRKIASRSRAVDASADDQDVEQVFAQALDRLGTRGGLYGGQLLIIGMMRMELVPGEFAIVRLNAGDPLPDWVGGEFVSVTRTAEELSIVCESSQVPQDARAQRGWRALRVAGTLDFSLTGVLASIADPLARAGVSIFAISTFDTDYVLVRELSEAIQALEAAGHEVAR